MKRLIAIGSLYIILLIMSSCAKTSTQPATTTSGGNTPIPSGNQSAVPAVVADKPGVGDQAPDLRLVDSAGKTVSLADYKGQVVWLNFWATW